MRPARRHAGAMSRAHWRVRRMSCWSGSIHVGLRSGGWATTPSARSTPRSSTPRSRASVLSVPMRTSRRTRVSWRRRSVSTAVGSSGLVTDRCSRATSSRAQARAHLAVSGTLAALIVRETTGRGQRVDTSLVQGLIAADYFGVYQAQLAKRAVGQGSAPGTAPGDGMAASRYALTLCTSDGRWVSLSPQQPHQAQALLRSVGLEWSLDDARFANAPFFRNAEEAQEWEDLVSETFRSQTYARARGATPHRGQHPVRAVPHERRSSRPSADHRQRRGDRDRGPA